jgi:hypothetical protein
MSTSTTSAPVKRACDRYVIVSFPPLTTLSKSADAVSSAVTDAKSNVLAKAPVRAKIASQQALLAHIMRFRKRRVPRAVAQKCCPSCAKTREMRTLRRDFLMSSHLTLVSPRLLLALQDCSHLHSSRAVWISSSSTSTRRNRSSTVNAPRN